MIEDEADTSVDDLFKKVDNEYHKFEKIPKAERRHERQDLCAMLYLHEKLGGKGDAVSAAEHDQIWLGFEKLEKLTEEDVLYITRCGVMYDSDTDSLFMWA